MKEYNVYIDISEIMCVEANSKKEAVETAIDMLNQSDTLWTPDDAEIRAEEIE